MAPNDSVSARRSDPCGVLVINKSSGPTSHDAVARLRSALQIKKAGHTGTLDPLATGVLAVCVGEATKLAGYLTLAEKEYHCTARMGLITDSHDATGKTLEEREVDITEEEVEKALEAFRGQIMQIPPMFSALKKGGKRLYSLARKGEVVEREARQVMVYRFEMTRFEPPEVDFVVVCGKGTYVRTLLHDLGQVLGCGATLSGLKRTRLGSLSLDKAVDLKELDRNIGIDKREELRRKIISPADAMEDYPSVRLDMRKIHAISNGRMLDPAETAQSGGGGLRPGQFVRMLDGNGVLIAMGKVKVNGLQPVRVMNACREVLNEANL